MKYDIKPLVGLGNLIFGLSRENVKDIIGDPDEIEKYDHVDNTTNECWTYNTLKIELTFSSEDNWLLGAIDIYSPDAKINSHKIIGLSEEEFIEAFDNYEIGVIEFDEEDRSYDLYSYYCENSNISFWLNKGMVEGFTLMPKFDESGENVVWPKC